jgi:hypothetical protein
MDILQKRCIFLLIDQLWKQSFVIPIPCGNCSTGYSILSSIISLGVFSPLRSIRYFLQLPIPIKDHSKGRQHVASDPPVSNFSWTASTRGCPGHRKHFQDACSINIPRGNLLAVNLTFKPEQQLMFLKTISSSYPAYVLSISRDNTFT